jgi:hypothetical protein
MTPKELEKINARLQKVADKAGGFVEVTRQRGRQHRLILRAELNEQALPNQADIYESLERGTLNMIALLKADRA